MADIGRRRPETLEELARRYRDSADTIRSIARRIAEAAALHQENAARLQRLASPLRECVGAEREGIAFSYLEYLEFTSAEEFGRFRGVPPVTSADIAATDWDDLARRLTSGAQ